MKGGDRVCVPWLGSACGVCEYCESGRETLCEQQQNTGYSIDSSYAEYAPANALHVGEVPAGVESGDPRRSPAPASPPTRR